MKKQKILISGAGIAGLTMARCLEELNIDYVIIEKHPSLQISSSGIALPFNAIQALRKLGLAEQVLTKSHQVNHVSYTKKDGSVLSSASLLEAPLNQDKFVALERGDLSNILRQGIESNIVYQSKILNASNTDTGVLVESNNPDISGEYSLVICAEGLKSPLRQQMFSTEDTIVDHGIYCWRFLIEEKAHGLEPIYMLDKTELFMAYPLSKDKLYCYGHIVGEPEDFQSKPHIEYIKTFFKDFKGPVPNILATLNNQNVHFGQLRSVNKPYYYAGNIVFIGDASSACSPLLQQGAACAFEDVLAMASIIKEIQANQALNFSNIGQAYEAIRKERVDWIVSNSDGPIKLLKKMKNPILRFIRNKMIMKKGPLNIQGWRQLSKMK